MTPADSDERQEPESGSPPSGDAKAADPPREAISTTDPAVASGRGPDRGAIPPEQTMVAETTHPADARGLAGPAGSRHGEPAAGTVAKPVPVKPHEARTGHDGGKPHPARPAWVGYVATGAVALACGVGGAWAYSHFAPSKDQPGAGDQAKASRKGGGSSEQGDSSGPADKEQGGDGSTRAGASAPEAGEDLKAEVRNLSDRFEALRRRVESMVTPRDATPPDLAALRVRLDELSRSTEDVTRLPSRFQELDGRFSRLEAEMKGLRDRAEKGPTAAHGPSKVEAPPDPVPATPPPGPTASANPRWADEAMASGIALFKKGKYPEAEAVFRRLQATRPEDARVWYFSALASGLATGRWDGDARSFVVRGAERERAGLPAAQEINSAFADLGPATGKDWLASYRSQLVDR